MGPRSGDRGNAEAFRVLGLAAQRLQWGRDLVIAEMRGVVGIRQISEIASMGPRSGDRGNLLLDLDEYMRPAPLQWGRDLVIAEMRFSGSFSIASRRASMGPRSGDRGNTNDPTMGLREVAGFNGAAIW